MKEIIRQRGTRQGYQPLVSIGLPVYNEERYLSETLDSLLSQDYQNIQIIVSDNASTDATPDICKTYAAQSPRIQYRRFPSNMGQGKNFKTVLDYAEGPFFMWAGGHDLWSGNFISACMQKLTSGSDFLVAVPSSAWIDGNGEPIDRQTGFSDTRGMDVIARYFTMFWGNMHPAYGLMQTRVIKTWPIREIVGEDLIMLTFLALRGHFVHAPEAVWYRRELRFERSYAERLRRYKQGEQKVAVTAADKMFPFVKLSGYLLATVLQSNIPFSTKMLICFLLLPSIPVRFFSGKAQYKVS